MTEVGELALRAVGAVRVAGRRRARGDRAGWTLVVVVATAAFAVRLWIALRGGGIGGTYGYDDGVYYSASTSLLWGELPYRAFMLLHPPGIMLALTPFALLGRITSDHVGFETARVAWMLLGALNATLVVRICRRGGLLAAAAGGLFYALWTPVARTEVTIRLEPLVTLCLLAALTLLLRRGAISSRRVLLCAGAALVLSASVKIWAIAPAVLVLVWLWRRAGTKAVGWLMMGGLGAGVLVDGPFLVAAPTQMVRMVVLDQLGRGRSLVNTPSRLANVVAPLPGLPDHWTPGPAPLVAAGLMVGLVAIACLGNDRGRFALSLLGVEVLVLVLSPSFFSYYDAFAGPGLALVLASIVVWLTALPRRAAIPRVAGIMPGLVATPLALTVIVGLTGSLCADSLVVLSTPFPATSLKHTTSVSRCVTSDSPDALILTDLLSRNHLRGCQVPVDLSGLTYDRDALPLRPDGTSVPRSGNARWQRDLRSYLFSGQSIFVLRAQDDGSTGAAMRDVQALPELRKGRAYALLRNRSFHSRDGGELR